MQWSLEKSDQLNTDNGQEMQFSFAKSQQESELLCIYSDVIEVVDSVKLLGLNISSDLTWEIHINEIVKKASKRLYFLVQLKRAKGSSTLVVLY